MNNPSEMPKVVWLPGLLSPQSFLTAIYLGASFDVESSQTQIVKSEPKEMFSQMPVIPSTTYPQAASSNKVSPCLPFVEMVEVAPVHFLHHLAAYEWCQPHTRPKSPNWNGSNSQPHS
ncbi:hypothetical protein THAOC_37906 [Thalassiosira oceanica]|uniref:Uncharacterized protein n=1 Tax=Thalassiosira oceanica TaxID=159749 RepID=K0R536_THAOC|nr:hypothetical protein THAOC_37906 [Thalassiosira oceanica]|eukprot:EJK43631.1 hypothetical protein THAOC_37906 [Thalassiosira oceanica]